MAKEKNKEAILQAAQNVFGRKGVASATLEEIAKEAKTDVRSLKSLYPKVDDLVNEIFDRDVTDTYELFTKIINDRGKADIKLTRLVRELLSRYQRSYPLFQLLSSGMEEHTADDQYLRAHLKKDILDRFRQNTAILGRLIAQGQSENLFTDVDPVEAAYVLRGMISAAMKYLRAYNREEDIRDHADVVMRIFLKGLLR